MRPGADRPYDVTVVGGGLIGLATAYHLLGAKPGIRLAVLEKEPELARHRAVTTRVSSTPGCTTPPGLRDLRSSTESAGFADSPAYARTGAAEMWRDYVKWAFVHELQRYVPKVRSRDLRFGPCMSAEGKLVEDFLLEEADGVLHVLNAPSPGATASLAIGRMLAERRPPRSGCRSGRDWDRTSDLPRVKRALSR